MLSIQPNKGDVVSLPQGVICYKAWMADEVNSELSLTFFQEIKKPSVAIFVENFNDNVSKLIYEDKFVYVYNEWIYDLGDKNGS